MLLEFSHVTGISKKFRLEDVHFSLPAGYIMGLIGRNGAGKTTLFDYILNPHKKYTGQIMLDGVDILSDDIFLKNKIGYVSEENLFFERLSAIQNARILGPFYEEWDMELFEHSLIQMRLQKDKMIGGMSRGERLKFQMAFAIAHHSVLYLLDDATVGMDPIFRKELFHMLQTLIMDEKASVLMSTHNQADIERKIDYIGVMEKGRMISYRENLNEETETIELFL